MKKFFHSILENIYPELQTGYYIYCYICSYKNNIKNQSDYEFNGTNGRTSPSQ